MTQMKLNNDRFDFLKKRWHIYLAILLFILGLFFWGRGNACENPHAIAHIQYFHLYRALRLILIGCQ